MSTTPEQVLADAAEHVATLRRYGHTDTANAIETMTASLRVALLEYLTWHDDRGACFLSGKPLGYFRSRRQEWLRRGLARRQGRVWQYREVVIPKRYEVEAARAAGLADAEQEQVA